METVLIVYTVCASALLVWSASRSDDNFRCGCIYPSSKSRIDYVAIPSFLLREWMACYPNLVIFDLHAGSERSAAQESFPGTLSISLSDLPNLLKWLPPGSTVVFSCGDGIDHLGTGIEATLLQLGIEAIYFLDESANFPESVTWNERILSKRSVTNEREPNRTEHSLRGDKR